MMTKRLRRVVLLIGGAACALIAAGVVLFLALGRMPPAAPLPNPNGYDDLVAAAQAVAGKIDPAADLDHAGLRALVASNAEALRLLRLGLSRRCAVPTDAAIANFGVIGGELSGLKRLAWLLWAEGRLAEMENRPADAARSYLDAIRVGTEMSRGGLLINRLVGIACEGVGGIPLVKLIPKLTCEQMLPVIAQLAEVDGSAVPWRQVLKNENRFFRVHVGKNPNPFHLVEAWWQARRFQRLTEMRHDLAGAHLRLLATELALRCYRCDQGTAPGNLQQLVPKYLQRVPLDPFSGRPLVYGAIGTNWLLYSLGPDRVDDGGKPMSRSTSFEPLAAFGASTPGEGKPKGDLLCDSPW